MKTNLDEFATHELRIRCNVVHRVGAIAVGNARATAWSKRVWNVKVYTNTKDSLLCIVKNSVYHIRQIVIRALPY
jgi:hypothetical protein